MIPPTKTILGESPSDAGQMTERQAVELRRLSEQSGEPFEADLSHDEAAKRIAYLKEINGE